MCVLLGFRSSRFSDAQCWCGACRGCTRGCREFSGGLDLSFDGVGTRVEVVASTRLVHFLLYCHTPQGGFVDVNLQPSRRQGRTRLTLRRSIANSSGSVVLLKLRCVLFTKIVGGAHVGGNITASRERFRWRIPRSKGFGVSKEIAEDG